MIKIFDKLNAAYGDQTLADSDQIKDKKFGKKQDVLNKEILDPDDPDSLASKVNSFNGIVIDPDNVVSTDKSDIEVGSSKIPTGNAVAGALSDAMLKAGVFDISAYNLTNDQPTPYADLEAALGNNGENVPDAVRKGGMQVKFIQGSVGSSDNKYVQCRLMADEFTTDTTQWSIADEGIYVDNPEFVYVKTDKDDKILLAIRTDGSIYYGAGCPQQVKDYIEERIAELSLDEYEDIVAFLSDYLGSDTTLKAMIEGINAQIATKVDKVEGKSLIDAEYASSQSAIENPEFLEVTTDSEDKVLEGIQQDGTKVVGGDLNVGGSAKILGNMEVSGVSYKVIETPEYLAAWVDAEDKIIFGFKTDGKTYIGDADFLNDIEDIKAFIQNVTDKNIDWDALSSITTVENPEFIEAKTDSEGKLLAGRTPDGAAFENIGFSTPKMTLDSAVYTSMEDKDDRVAMELDKNNKILSYRKKDGTKREEILSVGSLSADKFDYIAPVTDKEEIYLERPKYAELYIYNAVNTLPFTSPNHVLFKVNGEVLFHANCEVTLQGHGSTAYPKKNLTLDLYNASGEELSIKFGDMPALSSFHLKGNNVDRTNSRRIACAQIWRDIVRQLDPPYNKVNNIPLSVATNQKADQIFIADATYSEDGFSVGVYLNDSFWMLGSLKLKKNRKVYGMNKDNKTEIFLDDVSRKANLLEPFDYTDWEVKNPKMSGYQDPVFNPVNGSEIGQPIPDQDVLDACERFFNYTSAIDWNDPTTYADIEDYFVVPQAIACKILCEVVGHYDTYLNNVELYTWDGLHWTIIPYDMDSTVGIWAFPTGVTPPQGLLNVLDNTSYTLEYHANPGGGLINGLCNGPYLNQTRALYTKLRNNGFLTAENLYKYFINQINAVPRNIFKADKEKWPNITGTWDESLEQYVESYGTIEQIYAWLSSRIEYLDTLWLNNN